MVTLPKEFVATRYSGYFWNIKDQQLYSVKVTGELKPLVKQSPNQWNHFRNGWRVSVNGNHRFLDIVYLQGLKPKATVFPVHED